MARRVVPLIGIGDYVPDRGGAVPNHTAKTVQPADISDADFDDILDLLAYRRKTAADKNPCPLGSAFSARRLEFIRKDNNRVSFPLVDKSQAVSTATAVRDFINAAVAANPVVCVRLIGETWADILLELNPTKPAPTPGTPSRVTSGGKQWMHSGKITYSYDGVNTGGTTTIAVKVDTDVVTAEGVTSPPSVISTPWNGCVGAFDPANPCPSQAYIKPRYYKLTLLVGTAPNTFYQQTQVPVKSRTPADILTCGQALANVAATVCIAYEGETNDRLHQLL